MRQLLIDQYNVFGLTFVQMLGDAIFIPAGAAHQVQNIFSCIKIAEDFVTPEGAHNSRIITDELRMLTKDHQNRTDKLQVYSIFDNQYLVLAQKYYSLFGE
jgi:lysine-specific demethylase 3